MNRRRFIIDSLLRVKRALELSLNIRIVKTHTVSGGMINRAAKITTDGGDDLLIKWKDGAPSGFFSAEADGLDRLWQAGAMRVPHTVPLNDIETDEAPPYLVLEYIETNSTGNPQFARRFGEQLASLHQEPVVHFSGFGLERDNFIGALPQINTMALDWLTFYRDSRLLPQIAMARNLHRLSQEREVLLMRVVEKLPILLADFNSTPSLLHGDLWSGNYLATTDGAALIDPAVYYGEREIEIAYMELFGGFPQGVLSAYRSALPLDSGYERRRPLHQLYPLLVHLNHFGEPYGSDVEAVCRILI